MRLLIIRGLPDMQQFILSLVFSSFVVALQALIPPSLHADEIVDCVPKDNARPICKFKNPEDMVVLPGEEAILVGQYASVAKEPVELVIFDLATESTYPVYNGGQSAGPAELGWGDPACTKPPNESFSAHGMDIVRRDDGRLQLLVVQHGSREAVELFEVIGSGTDWQVEWRGCVPSPENASLNSVAALSNGDFYTTKFSDLGYDQSQPITNKITGHVYAWSQSEQSFRKVEGTDGAMPNGIVTSPEGRFIYMNATAEHSVRKIEVATGREVGRATVDTPDNARWTKDGLITVASMPRDVEPQDFFDCYTPSARACGIAFKIVAIDPESMTVKETLYANEGSPMGTGTVGLRVGDELFVGSVQGDRILRVDLIEGKLARLLEIYSDPDIWPTREQWRNMLTYPHDGPIVTTSFLEQPDEAHGEAVGFQGSTDEAIARYVKATTPIIERIGVKPIFVGGVPHTIIGDDSIQWDTVTVTRYPSADAYIELHLDPVYVENAVPFRRAHTKRVIMLFTQEISVSSLAETDTDAE